MDVVAYRPESVGMEGMKRAVSTEAIRFIIDGGQEAKTGSLDQ
jgi:hypothetical protein